jgi:NADH pyrophosphatase NudC (nudix superfamily)
MENYIIEYPPNTKDARATINGRTAIVFCPHCGEKHYHPKGDIHKACVQAHCKQGYYVLRVNP